MVSLGVALVFLERAIYYPTLIKISMKNSGHPIELKLLLMA
ncbi:MAG: hypothetical protein K0Q73_4400 [Paenibacillus sp.]|jgi:hypothetical protein|nr:hypothetical protein [Paenibacillus sp.]